MMINKMLLIFLSMFLFSNFACFSTNSTEVETFSSSPVANKYPSKPTEFPSNEEIQSKVISKENTAWKLENFQIEVTDFIKKTFFIDETKGYLITGNGSIFHSINGGKSWDKLYSFKETVLDDVFFLNSQEGFLLAHQSIKSKDDFSRNSILKTVDGGYTWKTVYALDSDYLTNLTFDKKGGGVAVGRRYVSLPQKGFTNFVLLTDNNGETWTDISGNLNQFYSRSNLQATSDSSSSVKFFVDKGMVLITGRGRILTTLDYGINWSHDSTYPVGLNYGEVSNLGEFDDGRLWVVGGKIAVEGRWGKIGVMRNDKSWIVYRLDGYSFLDAQFLSDNEVFAVGSIIEKGNWGGANNLNKGVILYSVDKGENWSVFYESKRSNKFTSIVKLSETKLLITGAKGDVIVLQRSK